MSNFENVLSSLDFDSDANTNDSLCEALSLAIKLGERSDVVIHQALVGLCVLSYHKSMNTDGFKQAVELIRSISGSKHYRYTAILRWFGNVVHVDVKDDDGTITVRTRKHAKYDREWLDNIKATPWTKAVDRAMLSAPTLPAASVTTAVAKMLALGDIGDDGRLTEMDMENLLAELRSAILAGRRKAKDRKILDWVADYQAQEEAIDAA
jgi:hypothetical protein